MPHFRFVFAFLVAAVVMAADSSSNIPSVETKLRRLEIRRVGKDTQKNMAQCRSLKRSDKGHCSIGRFRNILEFAFNTNPLRILGPKWMADDQRYLLYFAYDVEGRCPTILRSLVREILTEKLSLTVRREVRESAVLVMSLRAGEMPSAISNGKSCSVDGPVGDYYAAPAAAAGLPWSSPSIMETQSAPGYPIAAPVEGPRGSTEQIFRSCTLTELARLLQPRVRIEVLDETGVASRHDFALNTVLTDRVAPEQTARELSKQLGIDARIEMRPMEHIFLDAPPPPKRISYKADGPVPPAPCPAP